MSNGRVINLSQSVNYTFIQLTLVSILWGGTFIAGRYIQPEISPLLSATIRFILASAALILVLSCKNIGWKKVSLKQFMQVAILGLSGVFVYQVLFFYGLQIIPASRAALLVAINPAMIALISFLIWREKISISKSIGIILCVFGAFILLSDKTSGIEGFMTNTGDLAILGCVVSWGIYTVAGKHVIRQIGALHTVAYAVLFGTFLLIICTVFSGEAVLNDLSKLNMTDLLSLSYLGILGSAVAYVWYYQGVNKIGAANAGAFIALNPLTAVIAGGILLDEKVSAMVLFGGGLIIMGILIANKRTKTQSEL
ncbi:MULTISPECIES: DMT family transporter [Providencia]|uniref:EamA family transporter n=1 Tax=Providencia manganoxydans TaxID=2923283 RepID=A0ABX7AA49_9GAMM|nr:MULTISPECIES: DMT family transporter [Providencia]MDX4944364.1 DMT family transporter [Providencia manganoxydans]QQO60725.1 EamA family transporter [Providencia manganoxydans]HEF8771981.1 EamA family transporter [Providencia stuartii]